MEMTKEELQNTFILYETANFKLSLGEDDNEEEMIKSANMVARLVELKYNNFIEEYDLQDLYK